MTGPAAPRIGGATSGEKEVPGETSGKGEEGESSFTPSANNPGTTVSRTPVARKRTPQTQEKRRREHDKQRERHEKIAKRLERNAAKREAKKAADGGTPGLFPALDMVDGEPVLPPDRPVKE